MEPALWFRRVSCSCRGVGTFSFLSCWDIFYQHRKCLDFSRLNAEILLFGKKRRGEKKRQAQQAWNIDSGKAKNRRGLANKGLRAPVTCTCNERQWAPQVLCSEEQFLWVDTPQLKWLKYRDCFSLMKWVREAAIEGWFWAPWSRQCSAPSIFMFCHLSLGSHPQVGLAVQDGSCNSNSPVLLSFR